MKRYSIIVVLVTLIGVTLSCTSSIEDKPKLLNSNILAGAWELRGTTGGMIVPDPNNFKPGNGNIWKFTDTSFERIIHDSVYNSGSYTVADTGIDMNTGRKISQFIFNNTPAESFELMNDTLHIYYGMIAADGVIQHYIKIADMH